MRSLRNLLLVLIVLLVIAIVVVWTLPAQMAWRMLAPKVSTLQLSGLSGSIWHGHAEQVSVAGAPIGALDWHLRVAPLLRGELHADTTLAGGPMTAKGEVWRDRDGRIESHAMQVQVPAQQIQSALDLPSLQLLGHFDIFIDQAVIKGVWFEQLKASARWRDAGVSGAAQSRFGDVLGEFGLDANKHVLGTIHDSGKGPLLVQGTFKASPIGYDLIAHLRARDPNNLDLQEVLMYLGQRQPDGSVVLRSSGQAQVPSL
ncbi:MAG: type II secretion system protein N [Xanthomonadales bacterium]|nr:type II secretion system protein N [Xanthomonadales bacterium]